jgi:predicted Zn finger-like uncharacterized protein
MDLTTRCPQCGLVFQVTPEQLQLRKGFIRCGRCGHIFDGYEAIIPGEDATPALEPGAPQPIAPDAPVASLPAPPSVPVPVRRTTAPAVTAPVPVSGPVHVPEPEPVSAPRPERAPVPSVLRQRPRQPGPVSSAASSVPLASPAPAIPAAKAMPRVVRARSSPMESGHEATSFRIGSPDAAAGRPEPVAAVRVTSAPAVDFSRDADRTGEAVYVEPRRERTEGRHALLSDFLPGDQTRGAGVVRFLWSVLILAGLVLLVAQAAYVYRVQIASSVPALRPLLERACVSLHCEVRYPRQIQLISIMGSSLQSKAKTADSGDHPDQMLLQVTLRNNDSKPQEWPTLTLDLVDFSGTVVVKKNLPPKAYLSPSALGGPFAAKSEVMARVPIKLNGVKVNGFQLGKFYP